MDYPLYIVDHETLVDVGSGWQQLVKIVGGGEYIWLFEAVVQITNKSERGACQIGRGVWRWTMTKKQPSILWFFKMPTARFEQCGVATHWSFTTVSFSRLNKTGSKTTLQGQQSLVSPTTSHGAAPSTMSSLGPPPRPVQEVTPALQGGQKEQQAYPYHLCVGWGAIWSDEGNLHSLRGSFFHMVRNNMFVSFGQQLGFTMAILGQINFLVLYFQTQSSPFFIHFSVHAHEKKNWRGSSHFMLDVWNKGNECHGGYSSPDLSSPLKQR